MESKILVERRINPNNPYDGEIIIRAQGENGEQLLDKVEKLLSKDKREKLPSKEVLFQLYHEHKAAKAAN